MLSSADRTHTSDNRDEAPAVPYSVLTGLLETEQNRSGVGFGSDMTHRSIRIMPYPVPGGVAAQFDNSSWNRD